MDLFAIIGNEKADSLAKAAFSSSVAPLSRVCWLHLKSKVND